MEIILTALVAGVTVSVGFFVLGRTIERLAEHNARLTYDAMRMLRSRSYAEFTLAERTEAQTRMLEKDGPGALKAPMNEQEKERADWEEAFESPNSVAP